MVTIEFATWRSARRVGDYPTIHCSAWQEHSDCANHPMLPVVGGDDCDALDLLMVASYQW
jgi:hypothetical protein